MVFPLLVSLLLFLILLFNLALRIMSWRKESSAIGLADLTPCEAARGAMFLPEFQNMPDPLTLKQDPDQVPIIAASNNK